MKITLRYLIAISGISSLSLAVLHLADLRRPSLIYRTPDPVFPFVDGFHVYAAFALVLMVYGLWATAGSVFNALSHRHCAAGSGVIVGCILIYRTALGVLGITECNCLGFLSSILGKTQVNEDLIRFGYLAVLGLPAWYVAAAFMAGYAMRSRRIPGCGGLMLVWIATHVSLIAGQEALWFQGSFESVGQNPRDGTRYDNQCSSGPFGAWVDGSAFRVALTNRSDGSVCELVSDGRDICYVETDLDKPWVDSETGRKQTIATMNTGIWPKSQPSHRNGEIRAGRSNLTLPLGRACKTHSTFQRHPSSLLCVRFST